MRTEPVGRNRALIHEVERLRSNLRDIATNGDKHNGEITRRHRDDEPESWAARAAYFALYPERQSRV